MTEVGWMITSIPESVVDVYSCNIAKALREFDPSAVDTDFYINVLLSEEVELATLKVKLTEMEESNEFTAILSSTKTAQSGTKFVMITAEIENITKEPLDFNNEMRLYDDQGREFEVYQEAYYYKGNTFTFERLPVNIRQTGTLIYNVPDDSSGGYFLKVGNPDTNEVYKLYTK